MMSNTFFQGGRKIFKGGAKLSLVTSLVRCIDNRHYSENIQRESYVVIFWNIWHAEQNTHCGPCGKHLSRAKQRSARAELSVWVDSGVTSCISWQRTIDGTTIDAKISKHQCFDGTKNMQRIFGTDQKER